ncbi:hypothetical protein Bca101_065079 [Brassica carinata]
MLVEFVAGGEEGKEEVVMEVFYQCRCGDYFSVDSSELETMGFALVRDGDDVVRVRRLGAFVLWPPLLFFFVVLVL